jgi:hypothetical protein
MRELLAGVALALSFLLLFGCVGPQEKIVNKNSVVSDIGDREISVNEEEEAQPFVEEDVVEPPSEAEEPVAGLTSSDFDVFEESEFDIMASDDIIEP